MRSISREDHDSEKKSIIQSAKHENEYAIRITLHEDKLE